MKPLIYFKMIKQSTFSFSLDCFKMVIAIRKANKSMKKLGEVCRLRNKQYLRKIRKVQPGEENIEHVCNPIGE